MTLRELQAEVSALGFDGTVECDALFMTSANRAQGLIFNECCVTADATILAVHPPISKHVDVLIHRGGYDDALPVSGRAYSMYATGSGRIIVSGAGGERIVDFSGEKLHLRGFLSGDGTLTFTGESGYVISSLNVYGEIFGTEEGDIPDGGALRFYDVRSKIEDFVSFAGPVRDANGSIISNVRLEDGRLVINGEHEGLINIRYRRSPRPISGGLDSKVDIPREYESYLAILTASFIFLDYDEEKAKYYMELYREFRSQRRDAPYTGGTAEYRDVNGWA